MKRFPSNIKTAISGATVSFPIVVQVKWEDTWVTYEEEITNSIEISESVTLLEKTIGTTTVTIVDKNDTIKDLHYHKRPARVCYKVGSTLQPLLIGQVSSPFEIKNKMVTFDIINEIETMELGFSPDESQLTFVPKQFASQVWPLGFGDVQYAPAVKIREPNSMTLTTLVSIADPTLLWKIDATTLAYNQAVLKADWHKRTIYENEFEIPANTLAGQFITLFNKFRTQNATFLTKVNALEQAKKNFDKKPNQANQVALDTAKAEYQTASISISAATTGISDRIVILDRLMARRTIKQNAANAFMQEFTTANNIMRDLVNLKIEYCKQLLGQRHEHMVEDSSDFPQNEYFTFFINGVKFGGYVVDRELYIKDGPLNILEDVDVDPWAPDEEAVCDSAFASLNMFRFSENINNQWIVVEDNNGANHLLKVTGQREDKVYFQLVQWSPDRTVGLDRIDLGTFTNQLASVPAIDVLLATYPTDFNAIGWVSSALPTKFNRRETALYLNYISLLSSTATKEEQEILAKLAYLVPYDSVNETMLAAYFPGLSETHTVIGSNIVKVVASSGTINPQWLDDYIFPFEEIPDQVGWQAEPGSSITESNLCKIYVVNTVPSEIKGVYGYRTNSRGEKFLTSIPKRYYVKYNKHNLNTMNIAALVFPNSIPGFDDGIFVSYTSSVGPRITDILRYITNTYTNKTVDEVSFGELEAYLGTGKYPLNFVYNRRIDALAAMQQIAYESRCRVFLSDDKIKVKYLSARPTSVRTITGAELIANETIQSMKETEEIITKYQAIWRPNYLPSTLEQHINVRYNVKRYGVSQQSVSFETLNKFDLVHKSATFWAIRKANIFKRIQVETTLKHLDLEIGDAVSYKGQLCVITEKQTSREALVFTLELPIRLGEKTTYPYYWPSSLSKDTIYPPENDSYAGGFGPASDVKGDLPCP